MNKDGPGPTNPMLYDPIPEGSIQTTKVMQFVAATAGKYMTEEHDPLVPEGFTASLVVVLPLPHQQNQQDCENVVDFHLS